MMIKDPQTLFKTLEDHRTDILSMLGDQYGDFEEQYQQIAVDYRQATGKTAIQQTANAMEALCQRYPPVMELLERYATQRATSTNTTAIVQAQPTSASETKGTIMAEKSDQPTTPPQSLSLNTRLVFFKEIVTAIIGIILVGATMAITYSALGYVGDAGRFQGAKDILLIMNGLVGVVLGYYFGRIPSEIQARQAEEQKDDAQKRTQQIIGNLQGLKTEARAQRRRSADGATVAEDLEERIDQIVSQALQ